MGYLFPKTQNIIWYASSTQQQGEISREPSISISSSDKSKCETLDNDRP